MSKITVTSFAPCQNRVVFGQCNIGNWSNNRENWNHVKLKKKKQQLQYHATKSEKRSQPLVVEDQTEPDYYISRTFTDIPLYESPWALFDHYLEDKSRVFKAMLPDEQRSKRLNEEEWRIQMLPIEFLSLTINPVVDMRLRCKTQGKDYPLEVPRDVTKVLEFHMTKYELRGLEDVLKQSKTFKQTNLSLSVKGAIYSDRKGERSRLKGQLEMSISFVLPPWVALSPKDVPIDIAESVLRRLEKEMEDKVNGRLLADYGKFRKERFIHSWIWRISKLWNGKKR